MLHNNFGVNEPDAKACPWHKDNCLDFCYQLFFFFTLFMFARVFDFSQNILTAACLLPDTCKLCPPRRPACPPPCLFPHRPIERPGQHPPWTCTCWFVLDAVARSDFR